MKQRRFDHNVSVFFPAFNDAPTIGGLVAKAFEILEECGEESEVIVINDGSRDRTAEILESLKELHKPRLRVVTHPENMGYGAALRSGFQAAKGEFVFYTDGDGQYDVGELRLLLDRMKSDVGLVNGYKTARRDPWHRIAIGLLYNRFARILFRIRLRDIDCDFRLIRREVLEPESLHCTSGTICVELVKKIELSGTRVVEVPVSHYPRLHGRSQFFRVKSLATTFAQLCWLFMRMVLMPALRPAWLLGKKKTSAAGLR